MPADIQHVEAAFRDAAAELQADDIDAAETLIAIAESLEQAQKH